MKLFYLCILSIFLLFSCSETSEVDMLNSTQSNLLNTNKISSNDSAMPFNPANSYDYVGQLHYELYLEFYAQKNDSLTLSNVITKVETLANQNGSFKSHFTAPYSFQGVTAVSNLLACETLCIDTFLANSSLSNIAKNKMKTFLIDFNFHFDKNIESGPILDYIILFEDQIINSDDLLASDKAIILSTTSIARFSAYESKRRPKRNSDPDWDSLITNLLGNIVGSSNGIENGLTSSLVCGILTN